MDDPKEELIDEIEAVTGVIPHQTRLVLNILTHPRVIDYTKRYIRAYDNANKCTKYQFPWDCIKEAEAKFENIKFGWLGAGSEIGLDWICDNCRKRITED